ncbi:MAG TPA: DUF1552 domain-containing protein, partial [Polyangiaceae bacterium LLY-WYZ-15_(1-7)]|nr:DUF1552 domain-containing protein [Polyangiaceae bacterium LLY-WYZ-15_(1-7)]
GSWEPLPAGGAAEATETEFELNELMQPLAPWRDQLLLFENLDMVSTRRDPTGAANAHHNGATHCMTAANRLTGDRAGDVSIDQLIARRLNDPAPLTRLPSLEVVGSSWRNGAESSVLYSGPGEQVPFLYEPPEIYDRVFPGELADEGAALRRARRDLVFGFVRSEHQELLRRLPSADRLKVEQHLATRSDLEARLGLGSGREDLWPGRDVIAAWDDVDFGYNVPPSGKDAIWQATSELNIRLAVAALHADVTRVATVAIHDAPAYTFGYADGDFESDNPHDLTHKVNGRDTWQSADPDARAAIRRQHLATMEKMRLLLELLSERIEPDGSTLLDNTLVVYVSQIADGSHSTERLPWFTVGHCQGFFRTGRYLRFARAEDPERSWRTDGRPHNDLFVSVAQAMGVDLESFGNPEVCTGPIAEMR